MLLKIKKTFPRHFLCTIYKSFLWPHLDYGEIIHDQRSNKSLGQKWYYSIQCWSSYYRYHQSTPWINLYNELGLESLEFRRCFRKLCLNNPVRLVLILIIIVIKITNCHSLNFFYSVWKKSVEVHSKRLRIFLLFLLRILWCHSVKRKIPRKYGLLKQNKCLSRISLVYEKRIDAAEDQPSHAKHFYESVGFCKFYLRHQNLFSCSQFHS